MKKNFITLEIPQNFTNLHPITYKVQGKIKYIIIELNEKETPIYKPFRGFRGINRIKVFIKKKLFVTQIRRDYRPMPGGGGGDSLKR
jgi:hypothetical protein